VECGQDTARIVTLESVVATSPACLSLQTSQLRIWTRDHEVVFSAGETGIEHTNLDAQRYISVLQDITLEELVDILLRIEAS
jgi:hypothetical protein